MIILHGIAKLLFTFARATLLSVLCAVSAVALLWLLLGLISKW